MAEDDRAMVRAMRATFHFLRPYLWRYRRGFALGMGSLAVKDLLGAALPVVMRGAIDALTAGEALRVVFGFCGLLAAVSAFKGLFQYWLRVILIGISRDVVFDLRIDLVSSRETLYSVYYAR